MLLKSHSDAAAPKRHPSLNESDEPSCHTSKVDIELLIHDDDRTDRLEAIARRSTTETCKHDPRDPNLNTPLLDAVYPEIFVIERSDKQLPITR
jgi:hypothetical protein